MAGKTYDKSDIDHIVKKVTDHVGGTLGVFMDKIDDGFALFAENVESIIDRRVRPIIKEGLAERQEKVGLIEVVVKDTNKDVKRIKERVEKIEHELPMMHLRISSISEDTKITKIRTDKLDDIVDELKAHGRRLNRLEAA